MADPIRVALATNLTRVADSLDALAARAVAPSLTPRKDQREKSQAHIDAGAAIWDGVQRGLLNVPTIAALVGELAAHGYCGPESATASHECENLFHAVMSKFLYPHGEGLFPHFAFQRDAQEAHRANGDDASELAAMWVRHELHEQATGCRFLATLIESGADARYRTSEHLEQLLGSLASELDEYRAYVAREGRTGSEHESRIIAYVYQLRSYFNGALPRGLDVLWASFVDATRPNEELPDIAVNIAEAMLSWMQDNAGHVLDPRCAAVDFEAAGVATKTKDEAMNTEERFPYPYNSDLHWLWGWGERLRAFLADDKPPTKYAWIIFRPDRLARNAMMRFSIPFPHIVKQLDDFLAFTDAQYDEFLADESESHCVDLGHAMEALCERIQVGVKTIADAMPTTGSSDSTETPKPPSPSELEAAAPCDNGNRGSQSEQSDAPQPGHVFVSYCRKDEKWLNAFLKHLKPYFRDGSISTWSDRQIVPGTEGHAAIQAAIAEASMGVLLVTPDFLASDYIHDHELAPLLQAAKDRGVSILWIPVRACSVKKSPIYKLQALADPVKPLANMKANYRDAVWVAICESIEEAVTRQRSITPDTPAHRR